MVGGRPLFWRAAVRPLSVIGSAADLWRIRATKHDHEERAGSARWRSISHCPRPRATLRAGIRIHQATRSPGGRPSRSRAYPCHAPARTLLDLGSVVHPAPAGGRRKRGRHVGACSTPRPSAPSRRAQRSRPVFPLCGVSSIGTPSRSRILSWSVTSCGLFDRPGCLAHDTARREWIPRGLLWPEPDLIVETDGLRYHRTPVSNQETGPATKRCVAAGLMACDSPMPRFRLRRGAMWQTTLRSIAERCRLRIGRITRLTAG